MKINNTEAVLNFIKEGDCHLLFGIVRTKDNDIDKCKRHKFRFIVDSKERFLKKIAEIELLAAQEPGLEYRIYMTYNPRNVKNALKFFQKTLLDYSHNIESKDVIDTVKRLDLKWFSTLAMPSSSDKPYMLVDLDEQSEQSQKFIESLFDVALKLPTKNGYHYVIKRNSRLNDWYKAGQPKGFDDEGVLDLNQDFDFELKSDFFMLVKII